MKKIFVVITARASYSRVRTLLIELNKIDNISIEIILTSSSLLKKFGGIKDYLRKDRLKINHMIYNQFNEEDITSQVKTTSIGMLELANYFRNNKPDAVVTIADRHETIGTAIAASYMNIPLIHIQGGERSGNIDDKVRFSISALSDYHFVANKNAKNKLIDIIGRDDRIFNLGCPSIDIAKKISSKKFDIKNLYNKYSWSGKKLAKNYIVVLQHPVTDEIDLAGQQISITLNVIKELNLPTFIFWPNIDNGTDEISSQIRRFKDKNTDSNISYFKSLDSEDFLSLINESILFLGNSSVGIRESSFLGVPVVNIGTRQKLRDRAENIIDVDHNFDKIIYACNEQISRGKYPSSTLYGSGDSGKK